MIKTIWRFIQIALMLLGLLAVLIIAVRYQDNGLRRAAEPPWSVRTLEDFRKWRPQYERAIRLESGGSTYFLVLGEPARVLASGPSSYLFDARGILIGWMPDTGDDSYLRVALDNNARKGSLVTSQIVIK
jgi:hypothetical protein